MELSLDAEGRRMLDYLIRIAPEVDPESLSGFRTYSVVHAALGLPMVGRTWGDSLDRQGMGQVATWAHENGYPSITGFIISGDKGQPADGYFNFYGKDPNADWNWWLSEVAAAKRFPWPRPPSDAVSVASTTQPQQAANIAHPGPKARTVADLVFPESRFS